LFSCIITAYNALHTPASQDLLNNLQLLFEILVAMAWSYFSFLVDFSFMASSYAGVPSFIPFMVRRAQRLSPAFLGAFVIAILWDCFRPEPKIPDDLDDATLYLAANILFIPGLFPVDPLFVVNGV
jgi:hypothetical protein